MTWRRADAASEPTGRVDLTVLPRSPFAPSRIGEMGGRQG